MRSTAKSLHTAISDYYSDPSNTGLPTFQELNWSENIYRPRFKFEAELFRNSGDIIIVVTDPKNKCYKYKRLFMSAKYYWIKYETEDGVIEDDRRDSIISVAGDNSFDLQIFMDTKKPKYNYRSSRVR